MKSGSGIGSVIIFCALVFSCVNREREDRAEAVETIDSISMEDTTRIGPMWTYDYEADTVQYLGDTGSENFSLDELVRMVNGKYENKVVLTLIRQQEETVFVKIDSAAYLTQQMGSAGARDFMSVATFTLTEAEGVDYVFFDFVEGDHAVPGLYSRQSFMKK